MRKSLWTIPALLLFAAIAAPNVRADTITTTPNPGSVTLSVCCSILKDSATLSGASSPTGTITYTLSLGGFLVDTETTVVAGNGTYTTQLVTPSLLLEP